MIYVDGEILNFFIVVSKIFNFMLRETWKIASNVEGIEDNSSESNSENDSLSFAGFLRKKVHLRCKTLALNPPAGDNKV